MNSKATSFVIIGSIIFLLAAAGIGLFLPANKSGIKAPNRPAAGTVAFAQTSANSLPSSPYQYNAKGQLLRINYPDGSAYLYRYNDSSDKISETDQKGRTWTYVYDGNHHPLSVIDPEGRVTH